MPTTEEPEGPDGSEAPDARTGVSPTRGERRADRSGLAVAAVLLLACGAFVAYGVLDSGADPADEQPATPTVEVTYEVLGEGAADISYRAAGDTAAVVPDAGLPWRKTVSVPLGAAPIVDVTLGERGGTASCTLTVGGRHVQRAIATGAFGRTTCSGDLPTPEASAAPEGAP
ncbi:MmpS family transport accessory protein [Streptomyces glaucescens]|uniref:MmpS family transport accessory protein n=1 Tax=Streptomyces glaucescens TaxID=1907 RepID=UPI00344D74EB